MRAIFRQRRVIKKFSSPPPSPSLELQFSVFRFMNFLPLKKYCRYISSSLYPTDKICVVVASSFAIFMRAKAPRLDESGSFILNVRVSFETGVFSKSRQRLCYADQRVTYHRILPSRIYGRRNLIALRRARFISRMGTISRGESASDPHGDERYSYAVSFKG